MTKQNRQLATVVVGQNTSDGAGVKLKRVINPQLHKFDPFILFDEFGSDEPADYIGGFPPHPHRGFETVTYMLAGAMLHRDHLGNEGHLRKGDVQWMTAAHGIIHSEMPEQENGLLHGFQLWLNLPAKEKMKPPHYRDIAAKGIPHIDLAHGGYIKLIAGDYVADKEKISGAVTGVTTQPLYFDVLLSPDQQLDIPVDPQHTVLIYVYKGQLAFGASDKVLNAGQLGQLLDGDNLHLETQTQAAQFLVLAAMPLHEPVVQSGPFVMNTTEEIEQAYRDYRDGLLTFVNLRHNHKLKETNMQAKPASTRVKIHDLIQNRWSPRAFDPDKPVNRDDLLALLEAARWAASCFNDQPWRFVVCDKTMDGAAWQRAFGVLVEKNQQWAQNAPLLILSVAMEHFNHNGKPNRWAMYDTGAASASLCLQATALGLVVHQMGGFDADLAREVFQLPANCQPMAMMAVGYQADASVLDEDFKAAELGDRTRAALDERFYSGQWGKGIG